MQALLYCDLVKGIVSETPGGVPFVWSKWVQSDDVTLALRLTQKIGSEHLEVDRVCRQLRASIGRVDARPEDGAFQLKVGHGPIQSGINTTEALPWNVTGEALAATLNSLETTETFGEATVQSRDGSFLIRFANATEPVPLALAANTLWPVSFGRVRAWEFDGQWIHELRLIQAPVASTSSHARVVPPPPSISVIQEGGFNGELEWNEIQRLYVPPSFRGTYQLRRGYARSPLLSIEDGPEEIAEALKPLADEDGEFLVTNPAPATAHIEFAGSMKGTDHPLLEVRVFDAPPGDLTFTLSLDTAELATLLSRAKNSEEKLPFEVEAIFEDENEPEILHTVTLLRTEVTVQSELQWEELSTQANVDWLRPPLPRDYVPFTPDQVNTGILHFSSALGDGLSAEFVLDHNLDSESVLVLLRQNQSPGAVLRLGTDYLIRIESSNSLTITLQGAYTDPPPASGTLAATVLAMGQASRFNPHTHTLAQVLGLEALLDDFGSRLTALESLIPSGALLAEKTKEGPVAQWILPRLFEVYPLRIPIKGDKVESLAAIPLESLPNRAPGLLPAVHDAVAEPLPASLPSLAAALVGRVFVHNGASSVDLPGGGGRRGVSLLPGQFAVCDGRFWYRVVRFGNETSFYPTDFERELFLFAVNDRQLRLKKTLEVQFGFEAAVLRSNTRAQWVLVMEWGSFAKATEPAPTGENLADIAWHAEPLLSQRLILTPVPCVHAFGCRITRQLVNGVDSITASRLLYGAEEGGASAPNSPNFALRARLVRFDTEDSRPDPLGFIALQGLDRSLLSAEASQDDSNPFGKAIIKSA